jgi:CheY-like chemotaxis protein
MGRHGQNQGGPGQGGQRSGRSRRAAPFVGPMDHSYRNAQPGGNGNQAGGFQGRPLFAGQYVQPNVEPLPSRENDQTRIFAFVDDLFFVAKIQETARKINVKVDFLKSDQELLDRLENNGEEKPSLIIFDLNSNTAKPLTLIPKLRSMLKRQTSILGFVSHVQGDLKVKAQEAGCDTVMPRSAFSQNLPQLLRRHGAPEDPEDGTQ